MRLTCRKFTLEEFKVYQEKVLKVLLKKSAKIISDLQEEEFFRHLESPKAETIMDLSDSDPYFLRKLVDAWWTSLEPNQDLIDSISVSKPTRLDAQKIVKLLQQGEVTPKQIIEERYTFIKKYSSCSDDLLEETPLLFDKVLEKIEEKSRVVVEEFEFEVKKN